MSKSKKNVIIQRINLLTTSRHDTDSEVTQDTPRRMGFESRNWQSFPQRKYIQTCDRAHTPLSAGDTAFGAEVALVNLSDHRLTLPRSRMYEAFPPHHLYAALA
jgi:hypothetical protein